MLFDTHAHLTDEAFDADRDAVIERARAAGVGQILAVGISAETSEAAARLAAEHEGIVASVGIHPNEAAAGGPRDWDRVIALIGQPGVVALGETGLDRHWDTTPWEVQRDYFDRHLRLSAEAGLPLVIHMRDCADEMLATLRTAASRDPLHGVMHSFTADRDMAQGCLALGLHISFAGMVTFKKSNELRDVAAAIPDDRILVETDSPYLSPDPLRGKRNEPAHVVHTAARLAAVRGVSLEAFAAQTTANARRLFSLSSHSSEAK
jgi:TatD DNase family protein